MNRLSEGSFEHRNQKSRDMIFPTMWYVRPAKHQIHADQPAHTRSLIKAFTSRLNILSVKLLNEHRLEFLSLKGGCTGSSQSTLQSKYHIVGNHMSRLKNKKIYTILRSILVFIYRTASSGQQMRVRG